MLKDIKTTGIKIFRKTLNVCGFDIVRLKNSPMRTLLGMCSLPINTVIDVGANTGQFARFILNFYPKAQLICFEPLPAQYKILKSWAEGITPNKPLVYNVAVGDKVGEAKMHFHTEHSPSSSILPSTKLLKHFQTPRRKRRCLSKLTL